MTDKDMLNLWGNFDDFQERIGDLEVVVNDEPDELKQLDLLKDIMDIAQDIQSTAWVAYSNIADSHLPEH